MSELKKFQFHFREYYNLLGHKKSYREYFLDATAYTKEQAIELSLMGHNKDNLILIKDLSEYSCDDYIDYVIYMQYMNGVTLYNKTEEITIIKRKVKLKELLEDD